MGEPVCKICAHGTRSIYDGQLAATYNYCSGCGFMFKEAAKRPTPEQEKNRYLAQLNTPADTGYVARLKTFIEKNITPFQPDPKTALEFGSGTGPVLARLLFAPGKVYLDKTYDLITCTEVVEHLRDPLGVVKMLNSHLNPGGVFSGHDVISPGGRRLPYPG